MSLLYQKKNRIDSIIYCDKILIDLLNPFYEKIQKANLIQKVWLIKNNISANKKVAKIYINIIKYKEIKKVK